MLPRFECVLSRMHGGVDVVVSGYWCLCYDFAGYGVYDVEYLIRGGIDELAVDEILQALHNVLLWGLDLRRFVSLCVLVFPCGKVKRTLREIVVLCVSWMVFGWFSWRMGL